MNIILRDDYTGAETSARYGAFTDGESPERRFSQLFGHSWSGGNAMLNYEYYKRESLPASARPYTADCNLTAIGASNLCPGPADFGAGTKPGNIIGPTAIYALPRQQRQSVFLALRQDIGERLHLFGQGGYSEREFFANYVAANTILTVPVANAFLTQELADAVNGRANAPSVRVAYSFIDDVGPRRRPGKTQMYSAVAGAGYRLPRQWNLEASALRSAVDEFRRSLSINTALLAPYLASADPAIAFNPFGGGSTTNAATLRAIDGGYQNGLIDSTLESYAVKADGPLMPIPGGLIKIAVGADWRREELQRELQNYLSSLTESISRSPPYEREVKSAFGEIFVPLTQAVHLSASLRRDEYSDFGASTTGKIGVQWQPNETLTLRATWGESFKAPLLTEADQSNNIILLAPFTNAGRSYNTVAVLGADNLKPETARSWTAGLDFEPAFAPGLRVSMTWFDIDYENRVQSMAVLSSPFTDPQNYGSFVRLNPTAADVANLILVGGASAINPDGTLRAGAAPVTQFIDLLPDNLNGFDGIVDARRRNVAVTQTSGIDFDLRYEFSLDAARLSAQLNCAYLFNFENAVASGASLVENLNEPFNPIDLNCRGSGGWSRGLFGVQAHVNYTNGYRNPFAVPEERVEAYTTVDLTASIDAPARWSGWGLDDTRLSLSVINLFDTDPPLVSTFQGNQGGLGFDPTNASGLGRSWLVSLLRRW